MSEADKKTLALVEVLAPMLAPPLRRVLVVGCGSGIEAGILARSLKAETIGIDLGGEYEFDHDASRPAVLMQMDATHLGFPDESFDLVYCFHALEHISLPQSALAEMARVLRRGGTYL